MLYLNATASRYAWTSVLSDVLLLDVDSLNSYVEVVRWGLSSLVQLITCNETVGNVFRLSETVLALEQFAHVGS